MNSWNQDYGTGQKLWYCKTDTVTKNEVQFFCMKAAKYSKEKDKLQSARNKVEFFLSYLSPVRYKKEIRNTRLVMKMKFIIYIYQSMRFFDRKKRKSNIDGFIFQEDFTSQIKAQTSWQKYLTVQ